MYTRETMIRKGIGITQEQYDKIQSEDGANFSQKIRNVIDGYFSYKEQFEKRK
jgi:hypothetical protein